MPQERITNKMKIIDLISISLKNLIQITLNHMSLKDGSLKVNSISQIHFTIVYKIMSSNK